MTQGSTATKDGWRPSMEGVAKFLDTQTLGRIGTLGPGGQPQIANVAFSQNDKLELIIGTDAGSRKSTNMQRDARVAFEATDPDKRYTFQFEGLARRLTHEEFDARADQHFKKLPGSLPFKDIEGQVYFLLRPTWARFSDCSVYPWVTTEFKFEEVDRS